MPRDDTRISCPIRLDVVEGDDPYLQLRDGSLNCRQRSCRLTEASDDLGKVYGADHGTQGQVLTDDIGTDLPI
jgi:hypothetical protein